MSLCGMPYEDYGGDVEPCECWREWKVKARKPHPCEECGGTIAAGEVYGKATALVDGSWRDWRRCAACLILAELVATLTGACPLWGGLAESCESCNEEYGAYDDESDTWVPAVPDPVNHRRAWEAA